MHTLHLTFRADIHNGHTLRMHATEFLRALSEDAVWVFENILILDELFMNAVMHGSQTHEKSVDIVLEAKEAHLVMEVCDEGNGRKAQEIYDMLDAPPAHPYGRGLRVLVHQMAQQYEITDLESGGICVRVTQNIPE